MIVFYRKGRLGYYHSVWSGPFFNWPSHVDNPTECIWIIPGTVDPMEG